VPVLRLLQSVEEVRDQQRGDDADDRDDDQQLDQCEALLTVANSAQHDWVSSPGLTILPPVDSLGPVGFLLKQGRCQGFWLRKSFVFFTLTLESDKI
jgi:hypothetical protein